MEFECVEECSKCCVEREYYPSKRFGKVGVLLLASERDAVRSLADSAGIKVTILPRIGVSDGSSKPDVLAYQLMGTEQNGNTCPFLDTSSGAKSPHGGHPCRIYGDRPLACRAYPLIESKSVELDSKCRFCKECGHADGNLDSEIEALARIKAGMNPGNGKIWRYATGVCEPEDAGIAETGWIAD
ncbi:MAG: YkgJ family cysteine cluster protein [Nitrosopumilus sp. H8]|nr:MAG: YkgJ family cysteine cluster protein [Nitrosopumilus sp. H8]